LHAYSALEAQQILRDNAEVALALVDVVMESDHAGLELVEWIRKELGNHRIRLVLRTGQPGQAPEQQVIEDYDINDYKDKTELTNVKLKTLIYATLRSYRDIVTIENSRNGLERVISATSTLYANFSMRSFASAVLEQVNNLLNLEYDSMYASPVRAMAASHEIDSDQFEIIAATGDLAALIDQDPQHQIPDDIRAGFEVALQLKKSQHMNNRFFGYFTTHRGSEHLLYVSPAVTLSALDLHLLEIYSTNVGIAYENIKLREDIEATQRELIYILGEAVEKRSKETDGHVKRVALISALLARKAGLSAEHAELIKLAATIAHEHHEIWDGSGYPNGLRGETISLYGRITAIADVFDALVSRGCYKEPWPPQQILAEMQRLAGSKFDPRLVQLLFDNIDEVLSYRAHFPD
jgi:response regulator RpfG family c-di-GMP phosphodiesterase